MFVHLQYHSLFYFNYIAGKHLYWWALWMGYKGEMCVHIELGCLLAIRDGSQAKAKKINDLSCSTNVMCVRVCSQEQDKIVSLGNVQAHYLDCDW